MSQIFHRTANTLARLSIVLVVSAVTLVFTLMAVVYRSNWWSGVGERRAQPVPFSHEHHVRGLGIDCRYCHTGVEDSPFAGLPSTKTCMTCHSQLWTNAELLEPVRQAYRTGQPVPWTRVHRLPDFVYFDHSVHVAKGVACITCHGPVDRMPLMYQQNTLYMQWCLECHRHPDRYVGPKEAVFATSLTPDGKIDYEGAMTMARMRANGDYASFWKSAENGETWAHRYHVKGTNKMADCYTCHR
ncbi:MAG TPA: cytochrome c3 family protein [Elusimicrobiota bacterium]|nr:cytochrome c3 family protein [Elusimicrobiota bacterium]